MANRPLVCRIEGMPRLYAQFIEFEYSFSMLRVDKKNKDTTIGFKKALFIPS
jgi:hypothetical protein